MDSLVSKLKAEKDDLALKFNRAVMETNILTKELQQLKKEYGELLLGKSETQLQLSEMGEECENLKAHLTMANQEVQRLKDEFGGKIRDFSDEVKILKKQNKHLSEENAGFESTKAKMEEELRDVRLHCENLERKSLRLEEEMEESRKREKMLMVKLNEAEKDRAEKSKLSRKNSNLERDLQSVTAAATQRYRSLEKRLSDLERSVAVLSEKNSSTSGTQAQESFGPETICEALGTQSNHEAPPIEEKTTASSIPSPRAVKVQAESSESEPKPAGPVVDLCSSDDDDGELPPAKGLKRKHI